MKAHERVIDQSSDGVISKLRSKYEEVCMANLEGQKAPAFTLPGSDGKKHSLSDYAGKNVILWFYPKDDTPG
jgi:peroxiredoxin